MSTHFRCRIGSSVAGGKGDQKAPEGHDLPRAPRLVAVPRPALCAYRPGRERGQGSWYGSSCGPSPPAVTLNPCQRVNVNTVPLSDLVARCRGVGVGLRDVALQPEAPYGTATQRSSARPGPPLSVAQSLSRPLITGSSFFQSEFSARRLSPVRR